MLIAIEESYAIDVAYRHDGILEAAFAPSPCRPLLRGDRIFIHILARKSIFRRDEISGYPLRHEIGFDRDCRIDRPGAARGSNADPAHGFNTAAHSQFMLPRHDLRRGKIDCTEA